MRNFVTSHPGYKQDSVISPEIAHDLMMTCQGIGEGAIACPELLGNIKIDRIRKQDAYGQMLAGRLNHQERSELLQALFNRGNSSRPENVARGTAPSNN
jgi:glutamate--cysteine ligase catalytic subunit